MRFLLATVLATTTSLLAPAQDDPAQDDNGPLSPLVNLAVKLAAHDLALG